jgi:uncharacterized RDD family membrane protein YckC
MGPDNVQEIRYCAECGQPTPLDELARFGDHMVCPNCKNAYAQKLREGVNPYAAVAGGFHYAGFWIRVLAAIIDGIIVAVIDGIVQFLLLGQMMRTMVQQQATPTDALGMLSAAGVVWVVDTAIGACYEAFFISKLGATPGKMALSLKVVRPNGGPVDLGRAFGRYFGKLLSAIILLIGYIMVAFDKEKRGLHDMICDTRVIKRES